MPLISEVSRYTVTTVNLNIDMDMDKFPKFSNIFEMFLWISENILSYLHSVQDDVMINRINLYTESSDEKDRYMYTRYYYIIRRTHCSALSMNKIRVVNYRSMLNQFIRNLRSKRECLKNIESKDVLITSLQRFLGDITLNSAIDLFCTNGIEIGLPELKKVVFGESGKLTKSAAKRK